MTKKFKTKVLFLVLKCMKHILFLKGDILDIESLWSTGWNVYFQTLQGNGFDF